MARIRRIRKSALRLAILGRRFTANTRGMAAIEFAMLVPILIAAFLGCFEFSQAITVNRRVTNIAAEAGDLVAQSATLAPSDMADIMNITKTLLQPYNTSLVKVTVTSVTASATSGAVTVDWSYGYQGGTTYATGASYTLPAGLITNGQSLIVAETSYFFKPAVGQYLLGGITLGDKFFLAPRKGTPCVVYNSLPCRI